MGTEKKEFSYLEKALNDFMKFKTNIILELKNWNQPKQLNLQKRTKNQVTAKQPPKTKTHS